ncbi:transcriptional activator for leuABCD operon [Klebsiella michiganensis]|nr:transcriptional activator for leuABCD operon [Klebsiella michiganensis]
MSLSIDTLHLASHGMTTADKQSRIAYQGNAMVSVLNVVSQTNMVAIAPRWLASEFADKLNCKYYRCR